MLPRLATQCTTSTTVPANDRDQLEVLYISLSLVSFSIITTLAMSFKGVDLFVA
jgi:hypothetical protein